MFKFFLVINYYNFFTFQRLDVYLFLLGFWYEISIQALSNYTTTLPFNLVSESVGKRQIKFLD
jgi:hypothetical protein